MRDPIIAECASLPKETVCALVEGISKQNYAVVDDFLSEAELTRICSDFEESLGRGEFRQAGIGSRANVQQKTEIRQDLISWWEQPASRSVRRILELKLEEVRKAINQECALGLWEFEGHYAYYAPGTFYRKHIDQFRDDDRRVVSFVLFLNPVWPNEWQGQLRLYLPERTIEVLPEGGRLVCFLSDSIPHEVLAPRQPRRSFTGWFKRR